MVLRLYDIVFLWHCVYVSVSICVSVAVVLRCWAICRQPLACDAMLIMTLYIRGQRNMIVFLQKHCIYMYNAHLHLMLCTQCICVHTVPTEYATEG